MPKVFYTEIDVEDLYKRGITTIVVGDDVILTDLAREKARKLGVELTHEDKPPSAPLRPYIAKPIAAPKPAPKPATPVIQPISDPVVKAAVTSESMYNRVYKACKAQLGSTVDDKLLQVIIRRALDSVKR